MLSLCYCCCGRRAALSVICIRQKDISPMSSSATAVKTRKGPRKWKDMKTCGSGRANRHSSHLGPHLLVGSRHRTGQPVIDFATRVTAAGRILGSYQGRMTKKNQKTRKVVDTGQAAHPSGAVRPGGETRQQRAGSRLAASSAPAWPRMVAMPPLC